MELPLRYKNLYGHWQRHTIQRQSTADREVFDPILTTELLYFIDERLQIFERKELQFSRPYTVDPILNTYRFCNIFRELDRQTVFIHELLKPLHGEFDLWLLNMLFFRSISDTITIQKLGLLSFDSRSNESVYEKLLALESPKYGTAYIFPISVIMRSRWDTREKFFCRYYPTVIREIAHIIQSMKSESVTRALTKILPAFGFRLKFLWTEVLIDVAYQFPDYLDLYKEFPIGPGSSPTMKRLAPSKPVEVTNLNLVGLFEDALDLPTCNGQKIILSAENWEGIGCEFRKYTNLKAGTGRKRLY